MSIINNSDLSDFAKSVAADNEQKVKDGFGRLELAFARLANADGIDEIKRAQALEKLADQASQIESQLRAGVTIDEALAAIFGGDNVAPGMLTAPNADRTDEVIKVARQQLAAVDAPEATRRAQAAKLVLDGSLPLAPSGELEVVVKATNDLKGVTALEKERDDAKKAAKDAEDAKQATEVGTAQAFADIKANTSKGGLGKTTLNVAALKPETRAFLGL